MNFTYRRFPLVRAGENKSETYPSTRVIRAPPHRRLVAVSAEAERPRLGARGERGW